MKVLLIVFLIAIASIQYASALEFEPLPMIRTSAVPSISDFQNKDRDALLGDLWHTSFVRDSGQMVDLYLFWTPEQNGRIVGIFYFEDDTNETDTEKPFYQNDWFVMNFKENFSDQNIRVITTIRNVNSCVTLKDASASISYSLGDDCNYGAVATKETKDGWAAYVKFFDSMKRPDFGDPIYLRWAYVDADETDNPTKDNSEFFLWPKNYATYGIANLSSDDSANLNVNLGKIKTNDFLFMPTDLLLQNLEANKLDCVDNSIRIMADKERYDEEDVARLTAKINSNIRDVGVYLYIYDQSDNVVFAKNTRYLGQDITFLVDLDGFAPGLYYAEVELGVNGPKHKTVFGVDYMQKIAHLGQADCRLVLLYDKPTKSLGIFGQVFDGSGYSSDQFKIFLDRQGDSSDTLNSDDIRFDITKKDFGGIMVLPSKGWDTHETLNANARINKIRDGYEFFITVPQVSEGFKMATEQSDFTFYEFKKNRFPPNSFSTIPQTWATTTILDNTITTSESSSLTPPEILVTQDVDVNLVMIGDMWGDAQKTQVLEKLTRSFSPLVHSEMHLSGAKYNYQYDFVSASPEFSAKFFDYMKSIAEPVLPFYGEDDYDEPLGLADWIKTNHTEWVNPATKRFEVKYNLIDAQKIDQYIYQNLISKEPTLNQQNSANLVFIAADMNQVDYLHNYKLETYDVASRDFYKTVGLMGYGGQYNSYFFDLYAVPWDDLQGYPGMYNPNLINEFTNFHDYKKDSQRIQLLADYINNATSLLITPSYVYPPVYKTNYLIDLVIVTEKASTANVNTIKHFVNEEKISSELQGLIPNSEWRLDVSLSKIDSRELSTGIKNMLSSAQKTHLYGNEGPVFYLLNEDTVTRELVSWASTRESTSFKDFRDIEKSHWTIPVLVVVGEGVNQWYIDRYGVIGLAAAHPNDETQPCCVIGLTNDKTAWDGVGFTDLVIHEVGHALGLMHPFQGYTKDYKFNQNEYFNWYGSVMAYASPLHGCGYWYDVLSQKPCGNSDAHYTYFEKQNVSRGITTYLIQSAQNNIYRTVLEFEQKGTSPDNLPGDTAESINHINEQIGRAKDAFALNKIDGRDGALEISLQAALDSQQLAENHSIQYKQTQTDRVKINIPRWIADQANWWLEGTISESEFINAIQYLIKEKIIVIPDTASEGDSESGIPEWVRNSVRWWSEEHISDEEFVNSLQFLIKKGIIVV